MGKSRKKCLPRRFIYLFFILFLKQKSGEVEKRVEGKIVEIVEQKSGDVEKVEEKKDEKTSIFSLNRRLF
ncbi:hypothetical protein Pyn_02970 [Prunus yedoensis var. nudiflora]|uniref:Uncharacterized protein n=1 Tax=Prunus yedoensis var. nudiflora TaxID=2094558 RepID=A0A314YKA8_PRUYE|nr:hypothetical protein Pyn_02970 [Prunus yedoensis var. nudiflora]